LRIVAFCTLFALLQAGYRNWPGSGLERWVIDGATVRTAATLIRWISPAIGAVADGPRIRAPGGGLNVLEGCEGTDIAFMLIAAMLVAPSSWRKRALGLALGLPLVFTLNQGRILALFYSYRHERELFELLHGAVAPLVLVGCVAGFYALWIGACAEQPAEFRPSA
jgi:exosortase/archaeosortase family protein